MFAKALHALAFYVAAGIVSLGWALGEIGGWPTRAWWPLWFCGALLVFNADRFFVDEADHRNVPQRAETSARLRLASIGVMAGALGVLVTLPLLRRDWSTLDCVLGGSVLALNYSRPLLGFRFKDVPLLKTFFAPSVVLLALVALPLFHGAALSRAALFGAAYAWLLMLLNMTLCDGRDLVGDQRAGVLTLPLALGERRTRALLWTLLALLEALALSQMGIARVWRWLALAGLLIAAVIAATRRARSERFYEWCVEGLLFVPALAVLAARL